MRGTCSYFSNVGLSEIWGMLEGGRIVIIGRWGKVLGSGEGGCRMSLGVERRGLDEGGGNEGVRGVGVKGRLGCEQRPDRVNRRGASGWVAHLGHGLAQGSDIMRWGGV